MSASSPLKVLDYLRHHRIEGHCNGKVLLCAMVTKSACLEKVYQSHYTGARGFCCFSESFKRLSRSFTG
ncbi:hypothetical protein TENDBA_0641a [Treponema pallidum subsp. endemicum str. Bosnia A]|uniref:Uncharacterized protein n=1 Tax=Treponema pallidum subsp. endemicum str. Bosnia A TaxID=1155776 RepID=A0AAU8RP37_TREPL|nr:hypothetical protein TENDBA_0641a [Treponema pallidum subsp. endemicum str. Bosnia A]